MPKDSRKRQRLNFTALISNTVEMTKGLNLRLVSHGVKIVVELSVTLGNGTSPTPRRPGSVFSHTQPSVKVSRPQLMSSRPRGGRGKMVMHVYLPLVTFNMHISSLWRQGKGVLYQPTLVYKF